MIRRSFVEKSSAFLFAREEKVNNRQRKEFKKNVRFSFQEKKKRNRISFAFKEEQNDTKASCLLLVLLLNIWSEDASAEKTDWGERCVGFDRE